MRYSPRALRISSSPSELWAILLRASAIAFPILLSGRSIPLLQASYISGADFSRAYLMRDWRLSLSISASAFCSSLLTFPLASFMALLMASIALPRSLSYSERKAASLRRPAGGSSSSSTRRSAISRILASASVLARWVPGEWTTPSGKARANSLSNAAVSSMTFVRVRMFESRRLEENERFSMSRERIAPITEERPSPMSSALTNCSSNPSSSSGMAAGSRKATYSPETRALSKSRDALISRLLRPMQNSTARLTAR